MSRRLQEAEEFSSLESLRLLARAFRYVTPFKGRFALKLGLLIASLLPLLILPWPVKIIIDHFILGVPIGEQPLAYPAVVRVFTDLLAGRTPLEILLWTVGAQMLLVFLVGAVGTGANLISFLSSRLSKLPSSNLCNR